MRPAVIAASTPSRSERMTERLNSILGSWSFILYQLAFILLWCVINLVMIVHWKVDPYPYIFLNLLLGVVSSLSAPVIMMSQNRQVAHDRATLERDLASSKHIESLVEMMEAQMHQDITVREHQEDLLIQLIGAINTVESMMVNNTAEMRNRVPYYASKIERLVELANATEQRRSRRHALKQSRSQHVSREQEEELDDEDNS